MCYKMSGLRENIKKDVNIIDKFSSVVELSNNINPAFFIVIRCSHQDNAFNIGFEFSLIIVVNDRDRNVIVINTLK